MGVLGNYDAPTKTWTPSPEFVTHLQTDPNGCGFKNADGTFKPAAEIGRLATSPRGSVANTATRANVPKPFTIHDLMTAAPTTLVNVDAVDLEPIAARVREGDRVGVQNWADVLLARSKMSQSEHDAVSSLVSATEPDPSWPATVPGPSDLESTFDVGVVELALIAAATGVS